MKLSFSTDYGSPEHWDRLVAFAHQYGAARLVYWCDPNLNAVNPPLLHRKYPGLVRDEDQPGVLRYQERMRQAAAKTVAAGMEFWYVFQVLEVPKRTDLQALFPGWFNAQGEPDMNSEIVYQLIRDQLQELLEVEPRLSGIELWVMEGAAFKVADLKYQTLSLEEICMRIVDTVWEVVSRAGRRMSVDLHTAAGNAETLAGLFQAATRHPEIIISGDNVIGDFSLCLPFNAHLQHAAATNPVTVHFDVNGEYWGRNFIPTSALAQYAAHIEEARRLGVEYADGRVATTHNQWSPYANVLPSRRKYYPALAQVRDDLPLPRDLEIPAFDTLGGFNAEFFSQRVRDPKVEPEAVLRQFLVREFGPGAEALVPTFMGLEATLSKLFNMDKNYFVAQSCHQPPWLVIFWALDAHLTAEPGTPIPPPEAMQRPGHKAAFKGWPTPVGHRAAGTPALVWEKVEALAEAEAMLAEVKALSGSLKPEDRAFIVKQFEDLVFIARGYRWVLEAQAHYYLLQLGQRRGDLPNAERLAVCLHELEQTAQEWEARYPAGRYHLGEMLRLWLKTIKG